MTALFHQSVVAPFLSARNPERRLPLAQGAFGRAAVIRRRHRTCSFEWGKESELSQSICNVPSTVTE